MPAISIIMPCYNTIRNGCYAYTVDAINCVLKNTVNPFELVLIDNGSESETKTQELLHSEMIAANKQLIRKEIITNGKNLGAPVAFNQGIRAAKTNYIAFLNNDMMVTDRWDEIIMTKLLSNEKLAGVGSINSSMMGGYICPEGEEDFRIVMMGCSIYKKSALDKIGFLDEGFKFGNFEDNDYCLRAHLLGYTMDCCDLNPIHLGSKTLGQIPEMTHEKIFEHNRNYFNKKWERLGWKK